MIEQIYCLLNQLGIFCLFYVSGLDIAVHRFSAITDSDLEAELRTIISNHPNAGEVYLTGHLRSRSIYVQRERLRQMMRHIDPEGVDRRKTTAVKRRTYSVPYPNFLWHIDGAHKLIMYKLVVHAAIDGFSRMIVFLHCSNNNRAATVENLFLVAVEHHGWPMHIRTDHGGENVRVWDQMNSVRGADKKPVIVGSSVHNCRVERLHRDVTAQVCQRYKNTFSEMEGAGILNRENGLDLFCLHYVFLPRINKSLTEFVEAHNHHPISTEGNRSPHQLFRLNSDLIDDDQAVDQVDQGVPVGELSRNDLPHVQVQVEECPLSRPDMAEMERTVDPFGSDDAVRSYLSACHFVAMCMRRNTSH